MDTDAAGESVTETAAAPEQPATQDAAPQTAAPVETSTTTVTGALARFGSGRLTVGLRVDFILADGFDPTLPKPPTLSTPAYSTVL
jgi:hypothetical protein